MIDAIPSKVKVLHRDWKIIEKSIEDFAIDRKLGSANFIKAEIDFIDNGGSDPVDTIVHELTHVIYGMFDLGNGGDETSDEEEHLVRTISTGIVTVMRDNPELFPALQDILNEAATPTGD